jgi:hypothetical protein
LSGQEIDRTQAADLEFKGFQRRGKTPVQLESFCFANRRIIALDDTRGPHTSRAPRRAGLALIHGERQRLQDELPAVAVTITPGNPCFAQTSRPTRCEAVLSRLQGERSRRTKKSDRVPGVAAKRRATICDSRIVDGAAEHPVSTVFQRNHPAILRPPMPNTSDE